MFRGGLKPAEVVGLSKGQNGRGKKTIRQPLAPRRKKQQVENLSETDRIMEAFKVFEKKIGNIVADKLRENNKLVFQGMSKWLEETQVGVSIQSKAGGVVLKPKPANIVTSPSNEVGSEIDATLDAFYNSDVFMRDADAGSDFVNATTRSLDVNVSQLKQEAEVKLQLIFPSNLQFRLLLNLTFLTLQIHDDDDEVKERESNGRRCNSQSSKFSFFL